MNSVQKFGSVINLQRIISKFGFQAWLVAAIFFFLLITVAIIHVVVLGKLSETLRKHRVNSCGLGLLALDVWDARQQIFVSPVGISVSCVESLNTSFARHAGNCDQISHCLLINTIYLVRSRLNNGRLHRFWLGYRLCLFNIRLKRQGIWIKYCDWHILLLNLFRLTGCGFSLLCNNTVNLPFEP